jgi:Arc/MetJ family transcription regulator
MKRTNLVLDRDLLDQATRALGAKTYSETVSRALKEVVRKQKLQGLVDLFGRVKWQGNLAEMPGDGPRRKSTASPKTKRTQK